MYTTASDDQKVVTDFVLKTLKALQDNLTDLYEVIGSDNWNAGAVETIHNCAEQRESYYMADLLYIFWTTKCSQNRQNLYAVLQLGTKDHPSQIFKELYRSMANEDFVDVNGYLILKCPSWNAILRNLSKSLDPNKTDLVILNVDQLNKDFSGLLIQSQERKKQVIKYYWNFLEANYSNNMGEYDSLYALSFYVFSHLSMSFNFTINRSKLLEITGQLIATNLMPVPALSIYKRIKRLLKEIRQLPLLNDGSHDIGRFIKFLLFSHLGRCAYPASSETDDENILRQNIFEPLESRDNFEASDVPKQMHLDYFPSPMIRNGPVDGRSRDLERYERYMGAYNSLQNYQMWFLVIYRDYTVQGTGMPTYEAVLKQFPDLIFFYAAKCLQRVSHGHAIVVIRNPLSNSAIVSRAGPLFGTRDILASPLHSDKLSSAMEYIRKQSTHNPVQYNPGLLDKDTPVWKNSQAISLDHYYPGKRIFRYAEQGFIPYDANNFVERDMFRPIEGLRKRYLNFWETYQRVILAKFDSMSKFYRNPNVLIIRYPSEDYFTKARDYCNRNNFKWYILEVVQGQLRDFDYLFEPVIIIQDRDRSPNGLQPILERLSSREGLYSNLEVIICLDYEDNPDVFSTSSDDEADIVKRPEDLEDDTDGVTRPRVSSEDNRESSQANNQRESTNFLSDSSGDWSFEQP